MDGIRSIIVPTDFSEPSRAAARRAVTLARLDGASIHLIHDLRSPLFVSAGRVPVPEVVWEGMRKDAEQELEAVRKGIEADGVSKVTADCPDSGDVVQAIAAAVEAHDADLVVMGTHGRGGLKHAFLGSVTERTLRTLDRPVLAVKETLAEAGEPIQRILVAVDFSPDSDHAVDVAASLGKRLAATVDIIHAFDLPPDFNPYASSFGAEFEQRIQAAAGERLESVRDRFEQSQLPVTLHARRGRPSVVIAAAAEEFGCQLIVMGTRGNSGIPHVLLGSVAERTLRAAPCSVLTVQAETAIGSAPP